MSSLFNIEKLDESNYESWSLQIQSVLVHQDLWSVTFGETPCPDEGAKESDVLLWKAKNDKAKATIILSITPMQIGYVKNSKTASEAWKSLEEVHRPKGPVRKVTLFKQLLSMRMADGECVQQYICKFISIAEKLAGIGVGFQDDLFVIMLLASLPKSYESLVVALESRDELPKLNAVKIKLIEEGERRKAYNSEYVEGNAQAFVAQEMAKSQKKLSTNTKTYERTSAVVKSNDKNKRSNFKCYSCGKKGHFAAQCKEKERENSSQQNAKKNGLFAAATDRILHTDAWCIDSGASSHLCCQRNMFDKFEVCNETIMLAGQNKMTATGRGVVRIQTKESDVTLVDVLYVADLQCNFVSVSKAVKGGYIVQFKENNATIMDEHGAKILSAKQVSDLYLFETNKNQLYFARKSSDDAIKWHERFGHLNFTSLRELSSKQMVRGLNVNIPADVKCALCMSSKCSQRPYSSSENTAADVLGVVHTDVCGPISVASIGGAKYFLTFTDDKTRYVVVYFIKHKGEAFDKFKEYKAMVECQTGKKLKVLRSDNGTEFINKRFDEFLKANGILRQLTVPYTPQQNGVAERLNRTLIEMARCMLLSANVGESLWAEAVATAAYLRNRAPTKSLGTVTPYEAWFGRKPTVVHLRAFGSYAVALDKCQREINTPDKLEYQFHPVSGGVFTFKVRAAHDAHLALTAAPVESDPMYEVFIGGWENTKSVIRKDRQKPDVVEVHTPGILEAGEFRGFWVRWYDNVITVGREGEAAAFMSYDAQNLFPINFVGVCTGWGASGTWLIDDVQQASAPVLGFAPPCGSGPGCWVPAANGTIPPSAVEGGFDGSEQLYIGRARHEGDLIPGKLHPSHGVCYVAWGGGEHGHAEYEVLCSGGGQWVPVRDGNIPPNAFPGGETAEGEPLFIGRATHDGTITVGKVQPTHGCCYIPYGGEEVAYKEFEIYVAA